MRFLAAAAGLGRPLESDPALKKAGDAIVHLTSPAGLSYNFADVTQAGHVRRLLGFTSAQGGVAFRGDRFFSLALLSLPVEQAVA